MNYSRTVKDGSARYEALIRRNDAVRKALGIGPDKKAGVATDKPEQPKETQAPSEK
jgi:hypothetical protein